MVVIFLVRPLEKHEYSMNTQPTEPSAPITTLLVELIHAKDGSALPFFEGYRFLVAF